MKRMQDFDIWNRSQWENQLHVAFPSQVPESREWTDITQFPEVLTPFAQRNLNHTMLPTGGGMDMHGFSLSTIGTPCLFELLPESGVAYQCKATMLHFEYFKESPVDSFFLLETVNLQPTGVYENVVGNNEDLLQLPDGRFLSRSYFHQGYIGYDENGDEIPIPENSRLVTRFFSGKFLIVAKSSLWNKKSTTYDGRHSNMTVKQIRETIQSWLSKRDCKALEL